jgi:signal recognition particle GTPase
VHAIGVGESVEDLQPFNPAEFARAITMGSVNLSEA